MEIFVEWYCKSKHNGRNDQTHFVNDWKNKQQLEEHSTILLDPKNMEIHFPMLHPIHPKRENKATTVVRVRAVNPRVVNFFAGITAHRQNHRVESFIHP